MNQADAVVADESPRPRVSVVVPVRNRRALLRELLDALAVQTYRDFEVVVVDNASSDGSGDEAAADASAGRAVRTVTGDGSSSTGARIVGVAAARGEILAFIDSDCCPHPGWLAAGVAALDTGADMAQGITRPARAPGPLERTTAVGCEDGLYPTCNMFYRRAAYDAAGGFTRDGSRLGFQAGPLRGLGLGDDTLLGWRVRRAGRAELAEDAVVEHHVFPFDARESLRRAWSVGAFPALVREVPELRRTLLIDGVFLGGRSRVPLYLAAAALATRRRTLALTASAIWVALRWSALSGTGTARRRRVRALPVDLALDAVAGAALLLSSARNRTPVL